MYTKTSNVKLFIIQHAKLLFQCGQILRIFIDRGCMTEVCKVDQNWRIVMLLFLFSLINDEISLSSNCFSSFNLSHKLESIFAGHSKSLPPQKKDLNCPPFFFLNVSPICCLCNVRKPV